MEDSHITMQEIYSEIYRGCSIQLVTDEDPPNPREFSDLGTMVCSHRYYTLGDEQAENVDVERLTEGAIVIPVYMYDHSGITISTNRFSCPWDSGQVGVIFCKLETAIKAFNLPAGSTWQSVCSDQQGEVSDLSTAARQAMESEVEQYNDYLNNNVVGYITRSLGENGDEQIESVWGFYPDHRVAVRHQWDYAINQAQESINEWLIDQREIKTDLCMNI